MMSQFINPYPYPPFPQNRPNCQTDSFLAYMQDGKIFRQTPDGPQHIGVTTKTYDDLQASYDDIYARTQEYYDALVKAGIITPEPTQEELLKRQSEQLKEQAEQLANASRVIAESAKSQKVLENMILTLQSEIKSLKNTGYEYEQGEDNEYSTTDFEQSSVIPDMERQNQTGMGNNAKLSELPKRFNASVVGTQSQSATATKRSRVSSKRASSSNS